MNVNDLAKQYGFDKGDLASFLDDSDYEVHHSLMKKTVDDSDIDGIVRDYRQHLADEKERAEEAKKAAAAKKRALASMLITSGFSFDGYTIKKYSGYISGDDAIQVARGREGVFASATNVGDALMSSLSKIRRNALAELKEAAYDLGCNAVIGVDFDYITLEPETANTNGGTTYLPYVFGVTANGNAVIIEKDKVEG